MDEQVIESGDLLFSWDPYSEPIVADSKGVVRFQDIVDDQTMREELDESTGRRQMVIIEDRAKKLHPTIQLWTKGKGKSKGKKLKEFIIPVGAHLTVHDGDDVAPGDTLAKISREVYKTRDITGGLPRVAELFEARRGTATYLGGAVDVLDDGVEVVQEPGTEQRRGCVVELPRAPVAEARG